MKIREARQAAGLSQAKAAKACFDIPLRTWETWESGQRTPPRYVECFIVEKLNKIEKEKKMEYTYEIKTYRKENAKSFDERVKEYESQGYVALSIARNDLSSDGLLYNKNTNKSILAQEGAYNHGLGYEHISTDTIVENPAGIKFKSNDRLYDNLDKTADGYEEFIAQWREGNKE